MSFFHYEIRSNARNSASRRRADKRQSYLLGFDVGTLGWNRRKHAIVLYGSAESSRYVSPTHLFREFHQGCPPPVYLTPPPPQIVPRAPNASWIKLNAKDLTLSRVIPPQNWLVRGVSGRMVGEFQQVGGVNWRSLPSSHPKPVPVPLTQG